MGAIWRLVTLLSVLSWATGCAQFRLEPQSRAAETAAVAEPQRFVTSPASGKDTGSGITLATAALGAPVGQGEVSAEKTKDPADKEGPADKLTAPRPLESVPCDHRTVDHPLTVSEAIELAYQMQPQLRVYLEGIRQAQGKSEIAFSPFLPRVGVGYHVGAFNLNTGGEANGLAILPPGAAFPLGVNVGTPYELADLRLQWLICDFGKRLGVYRQSQLAVDIAQLQSSRAYQTVAQEVAVAYYKVLRTKALRRIAADAVRRAKEDLGVARKLAKGGVIEEEKVYRAEVQLAQTERALDAATAAEAVDLAALNLAIGLNVNAPTCMVDTTDVPPFELSLCASLEAAVAQRRELDVARRTVQAAQEGVKVARADFAPRIVAEGFLQDFQQEKFHGRVDLALAAIKLEWGVYEGGRRVAEVHVAESKIQAAMAQAQGIADTIAFQVNESYQRLQAARRAIDLSKPAVKQAQENYRLVKLRFANGNATATDVVDAETVLTRAEQDYLSSIYDYLIALAQMDYALGAAPAPVFGGGPGHRH
jgi:outer membrane protein